MSLLDCPDCWDTPCTCEKGYLGSKIHAHKELQAENKKLKEMLKLAVDTFKESNEDKWFEYMPDKLLDFLGLDEYGEPKEKT